jgi:hypothetical protein
MNAKERSEQLVGNYTPYKIRKKGVFYKALFGLTGTKPNSQRSIVDRTLESYDKLTSDLYFLAGMLTVLPFLQSNRNVSDPSSRTPTSFPKWEYHRVGDLCSHTRLLEIVRITC